MTSPPEGASTTDSAGAPAPMVPPEATGPVQADPKASAVTFQEGSNAAAGGKMEARSGQPPSSRQVGTIGHSRHPRGHKGGTIPLWVHLMKPQGDCPVHLMSISSLLCALCRTY